MECRRAFRLFSLGSGASICALVVEQSRRQAIMQFIIHDLRSPLANIMGGLDALESLSPDLGERERRLIGTALIGAKRMLPLIDGLLDIARLEEARMRPLLRTESIDSILDEVRGHVSLWADRRKVDLNLDCPAGLTVMADRALVVRILVNLISNGLKFTPSGSKIDVQISQHDKQMRFDVRDQGRGIAKEFHKRIFEKFTQVKSGNGSGLGLTFCQLAVQAHGGQIGLLDTPEGQGTTFWFTLPSGPRLSPTD